MRAPAWVVGLVLLGCGGQEADTAPPARPVSRPGRDRTDVRNAAEVRRSPSPVWVADVTATFAPVLGECLGVSRSDPANSGKKMVHIRSVTRSVPTASFKYGPQPSGANGMVDGFAGLLKRERYLEVPLCYGKRSRFPIIATLEGGAVRLGVDTGSASNYLLPSVAERLHLPEYGPPQQIRNSHTGRQTLYRTRAKAFSLAGQTEALEALLLDLD